MIKVCHITSVHPRYDTRIFCKECNSLVRAGYDVTLIVADGLGDEKVNKISILDVGVCNNNRLFRMLFIVWRIFNKVLNINAEIIHLHDPELMWLIPFLSIYKKKIVFDMHEDVVKQITTKSWIPPILRKSVAYAVGWVSRIFLFNVPVVFAEKSYARSYLWVKKSIKVLNMPIVHDGYFSNIFGSKRLSVGYIGGVSKIRGSLETIRALNRLHEMDVDVLWKCVGPTYPNNHKNEMADIAYPKVYSNINFYGSKPSDEGLKIISTCDIGLALLHPIPNYIESFPTKMFEYMMLGLPVVVSNFPLYRKIVETEKCGIVVDPQNPEEIAESIKWLMDNPDDAAIMGKNGKTAVSAKYNWKYEEKKLICLYEELTLGSHNGRK